MLCRWPSSESLRYLSVREVFKTTNLLGEPQDVYRSRSLLASSPRSIQGRRACSHVLRTWVPPLEPSVVRRRLSCHILVSQRGAKMSVRWEIRKSSSSRFCRQVVVGVRSREEHWKSGKRPLTPARPKYLKQDILHCSSQSVLKQRSPGQLIASFGLQIEEEYTELNELSFMR